MSTFFFAWLDYTTGGPPTFGPEHQVEDEKIVLCIIDTFNRIKPVRKKGGDLVEEDTLLAESFQKLVEATGLALMVVHHSNKKGTGGDSTDFLSSISGTEAITAGLHNAFKLSPDLDNKGQATLYVRGKDIES